MGWSITLGRVAGIAVRLHVTFLIFLAWIGLSQYALQGPTAAIRGLLLIGGVFGSVLLHEFGHALAARRFGVRTPDITLLPIGGVARLERIPERPRHELVVALAGPAVNVAIAVLIYLGLAVTGQLDALTDMGLLGGSLIGRVLVINVWLVLFNLIPAFPMDGGRVLRALLAERLSYARATQIAAGVGQAFAFMFALVGFFINPLLIFIALFVYMGAANEVPAARLRDFARGVPVSAGMVTRFDALPEDASLSDAVDNLLAGAQKEFPIVDQSGAFQGMLCREDMIKALSSVGGDARVADVMQRDVPSAVPEEMLESAFLRMIPGKHAAIPVIDVAGTLVGLLTRENIAEMMMIHEAKPRPETQLGWARP